MRDRVKSNVLQLTEDVSTSLRRKGLGGGVFNSSQEMRIEFGVSSTKFEVKMGKGVQTSRERGRPCTPEEVWLRHHA
ncbi:hypothetical protein TorRG33x02_084370 [Trema orientale]|uniref:Uncharacterized protein n=1 Tax=Trema orientale TaxID=63057 RepID=A0A2P5FCU6_TREOI|nr:hypothetical protein TorRG33x02_084370 [Trema orientale]